jgi:hypothetical protein
VLGGASALLFFGCAVSAKADQLSEKAVKTFMEYAWQLTPQQFSKPDGTVIVIDKTKKKDVFVPIDIARDVIMAGRMSAHAQICNLMDDQIANHRALMRREEAMHRWTPQQMGYMSQLHLTTVMLLTGRIKLVEQQGDKEVVIDDNKDPGQTCTDEQRKKVKELITAYVAASPAPRVAEEAPATAPAAATAAKGGAPAHSAAPGHTAAPAATGSTRPVAETAAEPKK